MKIFFVWKICFNKSQQSHKWNFSDGINISLACNNATLHIKPQLISACNFDNFGKNKEKYSTYFPFNIKQYYLDLYEENIVTLDTAPYTFCVAAWVAHAYE